MSPGVRRLTVLGKFKPFGLIAEATDAKPSDVDVDDSYEYFLFDPHLTGQLDDDDDDGSEANFSRQREHELFIRHNHIIWTSGSRVLKRFTLSSPIIKACWSHLGRGPEAFLCVLQIGCLTVYSTSGEVVSVPLSRTVISIWPLPFGLLLQQAAQVNQSSHIPFSSATPTLGSRERLLQRKEIGNVSPQNFHSSVAHDLTSRRDMSSHLILRDPLEEPEPIYLEERGKLNIMKDYDERTIWTSDRLPLMTSYNKGKMQHSVWAAEYIESNREASASCSSGVVPDTVFPKRVSFRRIWQAKGAKKAASKVFLATDDAVPVICFLILEQKKLLSVGLQTVEINNDILFDVKPDISWSVSAIAAAPVVVTRSQVKNGLLPHLDIIVLSPENDLVLYSGKQCLCKYVLPSGCGKNLVSGDRESAEKVSGSRDLKITGLSDAVLGCINLSVNHSQIYRCALAGSPSSSLANDCIAALAEGLRSDLYNLFLSLLWGDDNSDQKGSCVHFEWEAFCNIFLGICQNPTDVHLKQPKTSSESSWEFLLNSNFHKTYSRFHGGISSNNSLDLEGIVPFETKTGGGKKPNNSFELMVKSLDCLHAVYESLKMDNLRKQDLHQLAVLLCNIAKFLGEKCYIDHYIRDFPRLSETIRACTTLSSCRKPPNLFRWFENCLRGGSLPTNLDDIPDLIRKDSCSIVSWARKIVSFYSVLFGDKPVGQKLSSGVPCNIAPGSYSSNEELAILAMAGERFGLRQLDLLPSGVSLPLRHALDSCRESPPADWPAIAYVLLGREDMALSVFRNLSSSKEFEMQSNKSLISMSIPYMLHLHPVIVPSSLSESVGMENTKIEDTSSVDGSVIDGMEHIFNSYTQLRYGRDLRLNEVRRLLCSARPVVIQTSANPTISDQEQQQDQLWRIAQRTAVLPLGRGAFTLSTIHTLLTEAFTVPKLVFAGRLPAQQNAIVNLDPNVRNIQELKTWPEFHNAVAAGLRLAPLQGKVSRTWIKYNKPGEPNAVHAGLLFGLGLQGYLHVLNLSDIYQYFTQDHESTTVGLMLGLAASYRRSMQPEIAKALFFHVPARYQASYAEFEIPTLLQSAALVSVGILFEGSAHQQTMQLLLGEIGRRSAGDNVLEREGYAVSAGFSLGLVALGRGGDALGSLDSFVNRLLQYLGAKEGRSLLAPSNEDHRSAAQITDGSASNVDITAPGAIIALALMYLKTESEVIFSKLSIPQTHYELQCVRPDFIMLRVIARNLIMWSRIRPTCDWIQSQVPEVVKNGISHLQDDMDDMYEIDVEALVQAYVNIVTGACISLGLRFAGTRDGNARDLLYNYALYLLNEIKPVSSTSGTAFPRGISKFVDRGTLEMCLYLVILSLSVVMAGSGDLQIFRLLRFLRSRNSADGHANYGTQTAVSLATGFLFLGGGMRTFSTSNGSIAMLLITLYPRLPSGPNDNRCHLQAFRHLYVLATEARWLQTIDVDSGLPVYAPLEVTVKETELYSETRYCEVTPCILPERAILKRICVCGPRYWPQQVELVPEEKHWWSFGDKSDPFSSGVIYVKRKVGACSYVDDPVGCQSLLSRAMHKVFGLRTLDESNTLASSHKELDSDSVDHLVSTFSSDPSLIAFAQLCCDKSWNDRSDSDFKEFCLQVLFDCISKDRPALLQVYLSLYKTIGSMADLLVKNDSNVCDSLSISSLKVSLAYNEAVTSGRLASSGGFVQSIFLASLGKRCEEILNCSTELKIHLRNYLISETWHAVHNSEMQKDVILLSWYLKWFSVPSPSIIKAAVDKIKPKFKVSTSAVPLLRLLLPSTHISAISEIDRVFFPSNVTIAL
ncbi:Anaphase-promoting complex subunit 1 [Raphanus sativus]|uniref:Anaphase-promoting complex subunit 1 n=1 Tax=Raphanus sativus TaxID=3726 RepID=A0A9W3DCF1_RAPSA|nr:anaphase-promoting complex subunit 1 [Raphanus sativus]KAJ4908777.1 Anaphase-promoting complex subunit 1 [Raphanus sativus]